jgi:hypothetical protein
VYVGNGIGTTHVLQMRIHDDYVGQMRCGHVRGCHPAAGKKGLYAWQCK